MLFASSFFVWPSPSLLTSRALGTPWPEPGRRDATHRTFRTLEHQRRHVDGTPVIGRQRLPRHISVEQSRIVGKRVRNCRQIGPHPRYEAHNSDYKRRRAHSLSHEILDGFRTTVVSNQSGRQPSYMGRAADLTDQGLNIFDFPLDGIGLLVSAIPAAATVVSADCELLR